MIICIYIYQKRSVHLHPQMFLDKSLNLVVETTFLYAIDRKLSFKAHIETEKQREQT